MKRGFKFLFVLVCISVVSCSSSSSSNSGRKVPPVHVFSSFSIVTPAVTGTIDESTQTINVTVPYGTKVKSLVATYTITESYDKVSVLSGTQVSGVSANDFTNGVQYVVYFSDGSYAVYVVIVKVDSSPVPVLSIDNTEYIFVGGTKTITAALSPLTTYQNVIWTSTNPLVATISGSTDTTVSIKGLSVGTATIKGTTADGAYSATAFIVVAGTSPVVKTSTGSGVGATTSYALPTGTIFNMKSATTDTMTSGIVFPVDNGPIIAGTINTPFEIAETLTTYELWSAVYNWATCNGYTFANTGQNGSDQNGNALNADVSIQYPVAMVNWRDAIVWCNALTEYYNSYCGTNPALGCVYYTDANYTTPLRNSIMPANTITASTPGSPDDPYIMSGSTGNTDMANCTAKGFRLPTSNEYEIAARYLGTTPVSYAVYNNGSTYTSLTVGYYWTPWSYASGATANYSNNAATFAVAVFCEYDDMTSTGVTSTAVVKSKAPNTLGLYDMSGNLEEWCFDWFNTGHRMFRGGYFCSWTTDLWVESVSETAPYNSYFSSGLRVVQTK